MPMVAGQRCRRKSGASVFLPVGQGRAAPVKLGFCREPTMPYTPIVATLGYVLSPDRRQVLMIHRN
ncbi:MAG: hypothetical protein ABI129_05840, partial [Rhodanobacter sp.]